MMFFTFGFKSTILFVFFSHGIIFSILLLLKGLQVNSKSNLWLSLFVFLCTLFITPFMLGYAGWYSKNPFRDILFYIPFQQLLLIPPVLYFYTLALLDKSFTFKRQHVLHFFPAIAYLTYSAVVFIADKLVLHEYYFYSDGRDKDFSVWYQVIGFMSLFCYLLLSIKAYRKYKNLSYQTVSYADEIKFSWIKRFLLAFLLLIIIRGIFFILNPEWAHFGEKFWYYICFSILFYYISLNGYANYLKSVIPFDLGLVLENKLDSNSESISNEKKKISTDQEIKNFELLKSKLEQFMLTEKSFKNPELTLAGLSDLLGVNTKITSQIINQGFEMNFNDFVNYHRTQEVIRLMSSNKPSLLTLLGIALDCGFNSKSTFNRAFKKHTSLSPKAFLEKIAAEKGTKS